MAERLDEYLERTIVEVRRRLGEATPPGMPMAGVHLNELEARLLLSAAETALERIRRP